MNNLNSKKQTLKSKKTTDTNSASKKISDTKSESKKVKDKKSGGENNMSMDNSFESLINNINRKINNKKFNTYTPHQTKITAIGTYVKQCIKTVKNKSGLLNINKLNETDRYIKIQYYSAAGRFTKEKIIIFRIPSEKDIIKCVKELFKHTSLSTTSYCTTNIALCSLWGNNHYCINWKELPDYFHELLDTEKSGVYEGVNDIYAYYKYNRDGASWNEIVRKKRSIINTMNNNNTSIHNLFTTPPTPPVNTTPPNTRKPNNTPRNPNTTPPTPPVNTRNGNKNAANKKALNNAQMKAIKNAQNKVNNTKRNPNKRNPNKRVKTTPPTNENFYKVLNSQ